MAVLKKELEEELKLSSEDLSSHAWYHGPLRREVRSIFLIKIVLCSLHLCFMTNLNGAPGAE